MHKLLLADDSVTIQRVIELTFSGEDIQVIAVNDGEQAIARIPIEHPDIVLADIGMPKRSGYDVAAFVKGQPELAHIPVLLLAGAFERVDEARAEQVKCDGVLVKPFEPRHVVTRVRELVAAARIVPAAVAADLPHPAEGLIPSPVADAPSPPVEVSVESSAPTEPAPSPFLDASLDDYFEKLNAAFEVSGSRGASAGTTGTGSDSLDGYFDRLSAAFADLAKPLRDSDVPPASFDELMSDESIRAVESPVVEEKAQASTSSEMPLAGAPSLDVPAYPPPPVSTSSLPTLTTSPSERSETLSVQAPVGSAIDQRNEAPEEDLDGIADVLSALLAEQGEFAEPGEFTDPREFVERRDLSVSRAVAAPEPLAHDALVEEITRRVLNRLVPEVTASLKRLVVDELERVGGRQ